MALDEFRGKRNFDVTPEPFGDPVGFSTPSADGWRFVVQRHRATRLHYDLRLDAAGVLLSWAVPKGPPLDPDVRRMAVHVEDHPLSCFDFEGVIPAGQYGGGDVIVWDWGTWSLAGTTDPLNAVANGDLKHDSAAVEGWGPEDHPRSVKSGRTNDVAAGPASTRPSTTEWTGPDRHELGALDGMGKSGGRWTLDGLDVKLTNLDKMLIPARGPHTSVTKRDLIRHYAQLAPTILPYVANRPMNLHRYPDGIDEKGFWHKARPSHAPEWLTAWTNVDADPGVTEVYSVLDSTAALVWAANFGAVELHPWTSTVDRPSEPSWAMIDIDPGETTTFDDIVMLANLHRTALDELGLDGCAKVSGQRGIQIWIPVGTGYTFDDPDLTPDRWTIHTIGNRVHKLGDPLATLIGRQQQLPQL